MKLPLITSVGMPMADSTGEALRTTGFSYLSSAATMIAGALTFNEWMIFIGAVIGVLTFAYNRHYMKKKDAREAAESEIKQRILSLELEERRLAVEGFKVRKSSRTGIGDER